MSFPLYPLSAAGSTAAQVTPDGLTSLLPLTALQELSLEGCLGVNDGETMCLPPCTREGCRDMLNV